MGRPGRRWKRGILWAAAVLVLLLFLAPTLADCGPVRRWIAGRIEKALGRPATVTELDASWFGSQKVRGLRVQSSKAELGGQPFVEIDEVEIDRTLLGLIFSSDPLDVELRRPVIHLSANAGGRTNFDDFARVFMPRPRPTTPVRRRPAPLRRLAIREGTIRFRVVPPRRSFTTRDPLTEDPVIRPAGEGGFEVTLSGFEVDLSLEAAPIAVRLAGEAAVDTHPVRLKGELESRGGKTRSVLTVRDLALSVPPGVVDKAGFSGRFDLDLAADDRSGRPRVEASLEGRKLRWQGDARALELSVAGKLEDGIFELTRGRLRGGPNEELEASGSVTLADPRGTASFEAKGVVPHLLIPPRSRRHWQGRIGVQLAARGTKDGVVVQGTAGATALKVEGEEVGDGTLQLDVASIGAGGMVVRTLSCRIPGWGLDLSVSGRLGTGETLLKGSIAGDLGALSRAGRAWGLWEDDSLGTGTVRLARFSVHDRAGDLQVEARGDVKGYRHPTMPEGSMPEEGPIDLAIDWDRKTDRIEIRRGDVATFKIRGYLAGARDLGTAQIDLVADGSLPLHERVLGMLGLEVFDELRGHLAVRNLHIASTPGQLRLKGSADVDGLVVRHPELGPGRVTRERLQTTLDVRRQSGRWSGTATVATPRESLVARQLAYDERDRTLRADATLRVDRVQWLRRIPALAEALPGWDVGGDVELSCNDLALREGRWTGDLKLASKALTLRDDGVGFEADLVDARGRMSAGSDGVAFRSFRLRSPNLGFDAQLAALRFPSRGAPEAVGTIQVPLHQLARRVPDLGARRPAGKAVFEGRLLFGDNMRAKGKLAVDELVWRFDDSHGLFTPGGRFILNGEVEWGDLITLATGYDATRLEFAARGRRYRTGTAKGRLEGTIGLARQKAALTRVTLDAPDCTLDAKGHLLWGPKGRSDLTLTVRAPLSKWFDPQVRGILTATGTWKGRLDLEGPMSWDFAAKGREMRYREYRWRNPELQCKGSMTRAGDVYRDVDAGLEIKVSELRIGALRQQGVRLLRGVRGTLNRAEKKTLEIRSVLLVDRAEAGPLEFEELRIGSSSRLASFDRSQLLGLGSGDLTFERAQSAVGLWTRGSADFERRGNRIFLKSLSAGLKGGRVSGSGDLNLALSPTPWSANVTVKDVGLDPAGSRQLGRLVPIVISRRRPRKNEEDKPAKEGKTELKGRISGTLQLSGTGTRLAELQQSLEGSGRINLKNLAIRGTAVLSQLLALRPIQALRGEPYRVDNVTVDFTVKDGWVRPDPNPFKIEGTPFNQTVRGKASVDGRLNFRIKLPVPPFGYVVKGTVDKPEVKIRPFEIFR